MAIKSKYNYRDKLDLILICLMSSSFLIGNYILPISALASLQPGGNFIIAKSPDERQPEAVQQGIEQIPTAQPSVSPKPNPPIDSPIPPATPGTTSPTPPTGTSTPQPVNTQPTPPAGTSTPTNRVNTEPTPPPRTSTPRPSTPTYSNPTQEPSQPRVPSRGGGRKPTTNQGIESSPVSPSRPLNYKQLNFVDIAFGVLAPGDFKSQGRYFHFYQFQGRANQLIQIRLGGSVDQRRSNNLSLDPFMFVLDPNNNVLLKRGSGGASSEVKDAFVFVRLPANGTYTIAVTSQNKSAKGRYSLALRNDRASYNLDSEREFTPQSLRRQDGSLYDISKFQGKKDQLVSIRVDSIYEEFSPYIVLLDSQGKIVAADNAKDGNYSALIDRARLPKDETYYVVVISGNSLQRGKYRLTVF
jgi:Bacterial pre-peptidase C-terminal domain